MFVREMTDELPEQPEARGFDYAALDSETRIVVQQRTGEIKNLVRRNAQDIVDIGQKLAEVKEQLGHGSFMNWLKSEFNWSISAATRFMQVSEQFKFVNLANLHIAASALYLLAAPSTPEDARQEALESASRGETITHSKAKEIASKHASPRRKKPVTVDVPASTSERESFSPEHTDSLPDYDESSKTEPTRYATPTQTVRKVVGNDTSREDWNKQEPLEKKGEFTQRTNLSIELLDEPNAAEQSENSQLEEAGVDCSDLVKPEEIVEAEMAVHSKEEGDEDRFEELVGKILDTPTEVVEVTGGKSSNGHLNPPTDSTLVLLNTEHNHSHLADVGDRPNPDPPRATANNKISGICKVLAKGNFSKSELGNVVEVLVHHLGAELIGSLAIGFAHQYETVELCHACFAQMDEEAFSRLRLSELKISSLKLLDKEVKRAFMEQQNAEQESKN